jgi:hypothetical protein
MSSRTRFWTRLPEYLIALLLVSVPFYAFLTVWATSFMGHYTLIRLWPEFILLGLAVWTIFVLIGDAKTRQRVFASPIARLIIAFLALSVVSAAIAVVWGTVSSRALFYGLLLDTRPLIWFAVVWVAVIRSDWLRLHWRQIVLAPLAIVAIFALLQFFVLPSNFLSHFGYQAGVTITPAQTINQDTTTIRAQSFLRGPNSLGAYVAMGIGLVITASFRTWRKLAVLALAILALVVSFSRSAWAGFLAMLLVTATRLVSRRNMKRFVLFGAAFLVVALGALYLFRNNDGLQNVLFHSNEKSTALTTSDEGHASATSTAVRGILREPLGRGPGTAGPASGYNLKSATRNSESYLLNIGQELGVVGLVLFMWILYELSRVLRHDQSQLSRGVQITLVGLVIVNLVSYAWADPTLAYVWWGMAGIALATSTQTKHESRRTIHQAAKRLFRRMKISKSGLMQFLYFNLGGVVFFVTGYLLFTLLYGLLHWYWLLAKGVADLAGWALNYLVQHYLAFPGVAREQGHKQLLKKFIPFSLLNVLIDYAIVGGLRLVGISPFLGLWISSLFFTVWKWLGYKHWVFAKK